MAIPVIACQCAVCKSQNPKNRRMRASALLQCAGSSILIDSGPDFYSQAIKYQINALDALILTHTHYDHIAGIDELRTYNLKQKKALPVLLSSWSYEDLKGRYSYLLKSSKGSNLAAKFDFSILEKDRGEQSFMGLDVKYFTYHQGRMPVTGFVVGDLAYISDIQNYPSSIFEDIGSIQHLVISAVRTEKSRMHFSIEDALEFSKQLGGVRTYLTHISHEVDHDQVSRQLPDFAQLAYDGQEITFNL